MDETDSIKTSRAIIGSKKIEKIEARVSYELKGTPELKRHKGAYTKAGKM